MSIRRKYHQYALSWYYSIDLADRPLISDMYQHVDDLLASGDLFRTLSCHQAIPRTWEQLMMRRNQTYPITGSYQIEYDALKRQNPELFI
jgi:hypothetical protein